MANQSESEQRLKFFELLFGVQKGIFCLATSDPRSPKTTFQNTYFRWPEESLRIENYIHKAASKYNVYFCVNLLKAPKRIKDNCLPTRLVWADLDEVAPDSIEDIPPPIVIQSSPGRWQGIWRVSVELPPFQAEEYSKRVAYHVGADLSGWDLGQLLRVPLTQNFKYDPPGFIQIVRALEIEAVPLAFEALKPQSVEPDVGIVPKIIEGEALKILTRYGPNLEPMFHDIYLQEPHEDWSKSLWKLINICFRAGMLEEEVFAVAYEAKCNKYARDGRPIKDLWREVLKAAEAYSTKAAFDKILKMPILVNAPHSRTIVDEYREWASELTDAPAQFHDLSITIVLSIIFSNSVRYDMSGNETVPLLWGLILGESTLTRKTTSMKMALGYPYSFDTELITGTDATPEGLLSLLQARPDKVSVFFRDEVSGLFATMQRKDYMAGFMEILAQLYDTPGNYNRALRKEKISLNNPLLIFFGGGVAERVFETIDESFIEQGFLPRFIVARGRPPNKEDRKRPGSASEESKKKKMRMMNRLADLYEDYSGSVEQVIGGQKMMSPKRITAEIPQEVWDMYYKFEDILLDSAENSSLSTFALPTLNRLANSLLKMAVCLAAERQPKPLDGIIMVEEGDLINAAWYIQEWGKNSIELMVNAGRTPAERKLDKVYQAIVDMPKVSRSTIMNRFRLNAREASIIFETLEQRGRITITRDGKATYYWPT
jgi:hypothetical protein